MIIYLATSPTGRHYVGQTCMPLARRWTKHVSDAKCMNHEWPISRAIRKYPTGWDVREIWRCDSQEMLDMLEDHFIQEFGDYNAKAGGLGGRHTEETKAHLRETMKGRLIGDHDRRVKSPEARERARQARVKRNQDPATYTPEVRAKMSAAKKGKPWSAARRAAHEAKKR